MSNVMPDPAPGPRVGEALDVRSLGRKARAHQISGHALMSVALGLALMAAVLLLWAGIVEGPVRVVLLLLAAAIIPLRLMTHRLSGLTPADGVDGTVNSSLRRWLSHWEAAGMLLAGGLSAFGSGHDMGAVMGAVCAGLLLLAGVRRPARTGYLLGLYPTSLLALTAVASAFEGAWGWRGQTFLVGLNVIAVVLTVQVLRRRGARQAASATDPSA